MESEIGLGAHIGSNSCCQREYALKEKSSLLLETVFNLIASVASPLAILFGAGFTREVTIVAGIMGLLLLANGIHKLNQYKKLARALEMNFPRVND